MPGSLDKLGTQVDQAVDVMGWWVEGTLRGLFVSVVPLVMVGLTLGIAIMIVKAPLQKIGGLE